MLSHKDYDSWSLQEKSDKIHYAQQGDINTPCGVLTQLVQTTGSVDFVTCDKCKRGLKDEALTEIPEIVY